MKSVRAPRQLVRVDRPVRRSRSSLRIRERTKELLQKTPTYVLVSPNAFALIAIIPLLLSVFFPSQLYSLILREPNLMYHNGPLVIFYLSCIGCHISGVLTVGFFANRGLPARQEEIRIDDLWTILSIALGIAVALQALSLAITIRNSPSLLHLVFSGQGAAVKKAVDTEGGLNQAQPLLIVIICWAQFRFLSRRHELSDVHRFYARSLLIVAVLMSVMGAVLKAARYEAIPLLLGLLVIWLRTSKNAQSTLASMGKLIIGGVGGIIVFGAFSAFRGKTSAAASLYQLMGYGPASFNRLAAMLDGRLVLSSHGSGIYAVAFLHYMPIVHNFIDTEALFGLPPAPNWFLSEFVAVGNAGLNSAMIWDTVFGYYRSDLGNGVFPFAFLLGIYAGLAWNSFKHGRVFGLALYPYCAGTIVLWFSFPFLTRPSFFTSLGAALFLKIAEDATPWLKRRYIRVPRLSARELARQDRQTLAAARRAKFRAPSADGS
ncbi:hypothetical protein FHS31_001679 [Sphingomonas vulcanisoli]|uniref:Oligosaccharide repeat unit polymerase n=1 Tax=Sphingomonas vulcanisoli TaxID=1658060 RepID=A0ABX0TTK4_9SPHN|nr:hypothetical protein [Sphingomonas vulcanisoli]NIJ08069.1 hypothetical protein [Sphingomonas vulcanisoli]